MTVEAAFVMSIVLMIFMGIIVVIFYYRDKDLLHGAAYETAVVGSSKIHNEEPIEEAELESFCRERLRGKCIFMTSQSINVAIEKEQVVVEIYAKRKKFRARIEKRCAVTEPEKKIRDLRRLNIKNGAKNYN